MDLALRTLREGRTDPGAPAPLLLLRDALAAVGGPALLRHAIAELAAAIAGRRAQAVVLTIVALERPIEHYRQLCSSLLAAPTMPGLTLLDCFSDPFAWGSLLEGGSNSSSSSGGRSNVSAGVSGHVGNPSAAAVVKLSLPGILAAPDGLQQLQRLLLGGSGGGPGPAPSPAPSQQIIVFDSLSPLLDAFSPTAVAQLLQHLAAAPRTSSLLCGLHSDLHDPSAVAALEQLAAGTLALQPASELERSVCAAGQGGGGRAPQGRLAVRLKRRNGRVRAEAQLYCVDGSGGVAFFEPPSGLLNPSTAAEKEATAAATGGGGAGDSAGVQQLAQQLAGGMKLSLSREEAEARQRVQLPFEHQGRGAAYQTGDWRDYLPPEAGGRPLPRGSINGGSGGGGGGRGGGTGAASPVPPLADANGAAKGAAAAAAVPGQAPAGQLGRILYVRDSGSEHDSDEDPDDDLDL